MKVFDLIDDEPVTVKGAPGKDKVPAVVPAGSFVVPKENTPVAVKLTAGETVIPPSQVPVIDAKAKQAGYGGIQDLAPESRYVEARVADPKTGEITKKLVPREKDLTKSMQEMRGMTESWARDKKTIKVEEQKNTPNAFRDYKAEAMAKSNGYAAGGFVDANGNPIQDIQPIKPRPIQPVVPQAQANQIVQDNAQQAVIGNAENDAYKALIPANDGSEQILSNSKKVQDMLGLLTPKIDEKKQERLKRIAAINSIGQALSTAFGSYIGSKGGPILNTASDITPKALAEYQFNIEKDKDNKYKTGLLQTQEAIRGMHEVAQNELNNRRANQKVLADAQNMVSKFKLDRYQHNEEYRHKMDELAVRNGFEWEKMLRQNEWDEKKTAKQAENNLKLHSIDNAASLQRAKINSGQLTSPDGDKLISYWDPKTGTKKTISRALAMDIVGKALKERDDLNDPVYKIGDLITKPDNFNPEELGIGFADLMEKYGPPTGYLTPNGQVQPLQGIPQEPLKPNQNPSRKPVEPKQTNSADPYDKYKRR